MLTLYQRLSAERQQNRSQIMARESANKSDAEKLRNDIDHMVSVRVTLGVLITIVAMLVAWMGLRNVTALRETA